MKNKKNKSGQEEMIGFALIMIVVVVILLIFVGFSLSNRQEFVEESFIYKVESFNQAFLQYTTNCVDGYEPRYYSIRKLITACKNKEVCLGGQNTCEVLNSTLSGIIEKSWQVGENLPVKGYELKILSNNKEILFIQEGNSTSNSKGAVQYFKDIDIFFTAYY